MRVASGAEEHAQRPVAFRAVEKCARLWYNVFKPHGRKGNGIMKRVLCLLLLLLLLCPAASAREDYDDLYVRILGLSAGGSTYDEGFDALPEAAQALYVAAIFDMEMLCGGLCTFFCNEGPAMAVRVSGSLRLLGLEPIADAYEAFAAENGIDLATLDGFPLYPTPDTAWKEEYAAICEAYPFDEVDTAYVQLREELGFEEAMLDFAAAHPEAFER